jgi:hypothetical protein
MTVLLGEEYFSVPLRVVRRKLTGLRDSLVTSSTWQPEFKKPLETYPEFDLLPLDFAVPSCDACHLGGRMSTLIGRLSGLPYDRLGFEVLVRWRIVKVNKILNISRTNAWTLTVAPNLEEAAMTVINQVVVIGLQSHLPPLRNSI